MASKTVALDMEAYDLLHKEKLPGESFSDVVKRLARKRRSFLDFAGAWKNLPKKEIDEVRDIIRRGREQDRARMQERTKRMR
jgi:predicted CopG family antitoxin